MKNLKNDLSSRFFFKKDVTSSPTNALSLTFANWPEETTRPSTPTLKYEYESDSIEMRTDISYCVYIVLIFTLLSKRPGRLSRFLT